MDKNIDNNFFGFSPYSFQNASDNQFNEFNPVSQYEQGYIYYRYLTQQLEYKIKLKEFERLSNNYSHNSTNNSNNASDFSSRNNNERRVC